MIRNMILFYFLCLRRDYFIQSIAIVFNESQYIGGAMLANRFFNCFVAEKCSGKFLINKKVGNYSKSHHYIYDYE